MWRDELGLARVSVASSSIEPLTPEAGEALHRFRALLMSLEPARVVVRPGTALLFKDDRMLQGRDSFAGSRWLQRAYFTDSLAPLRLTPPDTLKYESDRRLVRPRLYEVRAAEGRQEIVEGVLVREVGNGQAKGRAEALPLE